MFVPSLLLTARAEPGKRQEIGGDSRLDGVIDQLGTEGILVSPLRTLRYFDQRVRLYNEQGREDVGFAQAFVNAAQLVIANSDLARGRIFAEKAASVWKTTLGGDSTQAIKHGALAQDPSKYELYGNSMKWKTKVDEAPQGLEPSDFEDWLWRREKPKALDSWRICGAARPSPGSLTSQTRTTLIRTSMRAATWLLTDRDAIGAS